MGPGRICGGDRRTRERQGHRQGRFGEIGRSLHPVEQRRREHHGDQQAADHLEGAPDDDRPTSKEQGCRGEGHGSDHHLRDRSQFTLDVSEGERDQAEGAHEEQQHTQVRQPVDGEVGGDRLTRAGPPPDHRPRRSLQPPGTSSGHFDRGLGYRRPDSCARSADRLGRHGRAGFCGGWHHHSRTALPGDRRCRRPSDRLGTQVPHDPANAVGLIVAEGPSSGQLGYQEPFGEGEVHQVLRGESWPIDERIDGEQIVAGTQEVQVDPDHQRCCQRSHGSGYQPSGHPSSPLTGAALASGSMALPELCPTVTALISSTPHNRPRPKSPAADSTIPHAPIGNRDKRPLRRLSGSELGAVSLLAPEPRGTDLRIARPEWSGRRRWPLAVTQPGGRPGGDRGGAHCLGIPGFGWPGSAHTRK